MLAEVGPLALPEVRAAELLPEVGAIEGDDPAHLMQTGAHALADAISRASRRAGAALTGEIDPETPAAG